MVEELDQGIDAPSSHFIALSTELSSSNIC